MTQPIRHHGLLIVLCGPSGVGKSTISRMLAERLNVSYTVSATTRPKTAKDDEGKTYEHIDQAEFFRRLDSDEFLEYAQVYGDYYGTPKHPALDYLADGRGRAAGDRRAGRAAGAVPVPRRPDDLHPAAGRADAAAAARRRAAATAPRTSSKRFRAARREIHMAKGSRAFDFMVFNDDLDRAVAEIENIIEIERAGGI